MTEQSSMNKVSLAYLLVQMYNRVYSRDLKSASIIPCNPINTSNNPINAPLRHTYAHVDELLLK
jgi:hypothetical protein